MRASLFLTACSTLLLATGCALHNVNSDIMPAASVQAGYPALEAITGRTETEDIQTGRAWWLELNRPALNALIVQSFKGNQDIAAAVSSIRQARALQVQTRSELFPKVNAEGRISDSREGSDDQHSTREIGVTLSWEIDLFDRIDAAARADELETIAREENLNALRLSLSAEIANAYVGAIAASNKLQLLNKQLETDQELLTLIELRYESGVGTIVEVLQQKSQVAESKSLIPPAEADWRVYENRLDVLTGKSPDGHNRIIPKEDLSFVSGLPKIGVPADLLMNRPDLRAARAELVAADMDIGAAIAERLPKITLSGSYLYSDTPTFSGPVGTVVSAFVQPLLDWGERKAEVERNRALYSERLAMFTQLFLEATEEVENALYQEQKQREYITLLDQRRIILQHTVEETEALYKQGVDDYLPVLNALQELRGVERDLVTERLNLINFRIALHKSIGGSIQRQPQVNQG